MKKMSTLFKKDPNDLGRVINEIDQKNDWVIKEGMGIRQAARGFGLAINTIRGMVKE